MDDDEREEVWKEFREAVNMTASELDRHLATEESEEVGQKDAPSDESVGHASGRRIVDLLRTRKDELSERDYEHMRKVVGYVHRHAAQRPAGPVEDTAWRYSLMNWGHDPTK